MRLRIFSNCDHLRELRVAFVLFVSSFVPFVSCSTPPARAERAPQAAAWRTVGRWTGTGNRQTESFDVTNGSLRVTWAARAAGSAGPPRLKVSLHSAISGRPLQTIVDVQGAGAGSAYAADDPRVSYLVMESGHAEWSVTLEEVLATSP